MNERDSKLSANAERAAVASVALVGALAASGPAAGVLSLLALFPPAVSAVLPAFFDRKGKEARDWWEEVLGSPGSDQGIAAEIESRMNRPETQDAVMAGFRALFDRIAPSTRTPLAMLTREYAQTGRQPDWFFRAVARTLTDVTEDEYAGLKTLVVATAASRFGEGATVRLNPQPGADDVNAEFKVTSDPMGFLDVQGGLAIMRAFSLLTAVGLAAPPKGGAPGSSETRTMVFRTGVLERLIGLLRNPKI